MLNLNQAWLTIAEAYETEPDERTLDQHALTWVGICYAAGELYRTERITRSFRDIIRDASLDEAERVNDGGCWLAPRNRSGDLIRAKFCREQADAS